MFQEAFTESGNVVVSPYSLYSVLFVLWIGGNGKTSEDIADVMKVKPQTPKIFLQSPNHTNFIAASKIYVANGTPITQQFSNFVQVVDFSQPTSVHDINAWITQTTNGKLTQFLDPKEINADTAMLLLNVIYFKGAWSKPFDSVSKGKFHNADNTSVTVQFINDIVRFNLHAHLIHFVYTH